MELSARCEQMTERGGVYLMADRYSLELGNPDRLFKVGGTGSDPRRRLDQHATSMPRGAVLLDVYPTPDDFADDGWGVFENMLHVWLSLEGAENSRSAIEFSSRPSEVWDGPGIASRGPQEWFRLWDNFDLAATVDAILACHRQFEPRPNDPDVLWSGVWARNARQHLEQRAS